MTEYNSSPFEFLDLLLDYHTKSKTIPGYISNILSAVSHLPSVLPEPRDVYQISSSGPLFHAFHLERLEKCVHHFLTSGQTVEVVRSVLKILRDDLESYHSLDDSGSGTERRKKLEADATRIRNPEDLAIAFSLSTRLASIILTAIPFHSTTDPVRHDVYRLLDEAQTSFIRPSLNKMLKATQNTPSHDTWAIQIVTAASLRLWHNLDRMPGSHSHYDPILWTTLLEAMGRTEILPELHYELVCAISFASLGTLITLSRSSMLSSISA